MLDSVSSNAVVAKIRSIHGTMLKADDYGELISHRSIAEIADDLKHFPRYRDVLRDVDVNTVHRGLLESLLQKADFDIYARLCSFQELDKIAFYNFVIRRLEYEQLLNLVNAVNSGLDRRFIEKLPGYVIRHSDIDLLGLSQAESFADILSALKGSAYYKAMKSVKILENGKADFTDCELKLRLAYYSAILDNIDKSFFGTDRTELKKLVGMSVDIINIVNCYRLKAYFGYTPQQIKVRQLPFTRIGKSTMNRLYESDSAEELAHRIEKTIYGRFFAGDYGHIETKMHLYYFRQLEHTLASTTSAPVAITAFTELCRIETKNVTHIIEGVRYDVEPALIDEMIIRAKEK